jgi:nucleoside-diphosphate-sugar epimerase
MLHLSDLVNVGLLKAALGDAPSTESHAPRSITCPMRVLIAGCRYVDSALGVLLAAEAHPVLGLRRDTSKLSSPITPVQVDLSSPLPSDALPPNLDAIVYAATPSGSTDEAYRAAYVDGARNVISALESQKSLHRVVFVFSTEVYAQRGSEWVDEEFPTEPESFSGKRLLDGERRVLRSFPASILRLGGIYGPGRITAIERAFRGSRKA